MPRWSTHEEMKRFIEERDSDPKRQRQCLSKTMLTLNAAKTIAKEESLYYYQCPYGHGHWHLTSKVPWGT